MRGVTRQGKTPGAVAAAMAAMAAAVVAAPAAGQGWIEPRPGLPGVWGVEKVRTSVTVRVQDRVAQVEVEEWFRNNGGGLGEGDYVYPLPGEAVFTDYSLYQGDEELRGEMMDATQARSIYERIVRSQKDPALIELLGKGMVRARVFPIEPGQMRRITLRYTQVLDRAGDALQFRYVAGGRHRGIVPMDAVPMPRIEPPQGRPRPPIPEPRSGQGGQLMTTSERVPVSFTMIVERAGEYRDAFSPTHSLRVERDGGRMTIRPRDELTGDFAVFLPFARSAVGLTLATHRPTGEDGYFMLTLSPGAVAESRVPRDVTVVVDVSGSMSGEKMEQARRALHQLLGTLGEADRVRLIAFSSRAVQWRDGWAVATRNDLRDARAWVDDLRAGGGTNISEALEMAFRAESPSDRLPVVVFMTDGLPTNGETNAERIAAMVEAGRGRARIFAFGVGYDVNTVLLDRLSEAARGTTQYVRPGEDVEEALSLLASRIRHPVLTDLALERGGLNLREIHPRELPDLFAGEELVLFGRYGGSGAGTLAVRGRRGDRPERYTTNVTLPASAEGGEWIARLWASRKVGDLDRRIRTAQADGASPEQVRELMEELRATALRYGLLTGQTSYLVLEPGVTVAGMMRDAAASPPPAFSGQAAVARAEAARRSREVSSVADMQRAQEAGGVLNEVVVTGAMSGGSARVVAGRTFTLRDGVWQDGAVDTTKRVVHVEPFSDAYFALVRALPELALVLRELDAVAVGGERVTIRVAPGGTTSLSGSDVRRVVAEFRGR